MGQEFRVNTYQDNWQRNANVTTFADGGFLVVWESFYRNYDPDVEDDLYVNYVAAQRYDANGVRVGGERIIDLVDGCYSGSPDVVTLSDGGYAVVFLFDNYDAISTIKEKVYVNIYNADGTLRTGDIRVDTVPSNDARSPEIFATANGGFNVVFGVYRATSDEVYMQGFNRNGVPLGGNTLLTTNVRDFDQGYAQSSTLQNGNTITVWRSEASFELGTDLDANEIRGTLTDTAGRVIRSDFSLGQAQGTITSFGNSNGLAYDVAGLASGGFVMSHTMYPDDVGVVAPDFSDTIVVRFFDSAGNLTARDIPVHTTDELTYGTSVTQLATGEIVVEWEQVNGRPSNTDIMGRVLSSTGQALTDTFVISVNGLNPDDRIFDDQEDPEVEALAGGGFVVSYMSYSIDNDDDGIAARIFGRATAADDRINTDATRMMAGLGGDDTISGSAAGNRVFGNQGADALYGFGGADALFGGTSMDRLSGGTGADRLAGGTGNDTLTGGAGADWFVFDTRATATNRDRITDFTSNDRLILDNAAFTGIGAAGNLRDTRFDVLGGAATTPSDRILYDRSTGVVYYDSNGSGTGGRIAIVTLEDRPYLSADDLRII